MSNGDVRLSNAERHELAVVLMMAKVLLGVADSLCTSLIDYDDVFAFRIRVLKAWHAAGHLIAKYDINDTVEEAIALDIAIDEVVRARDLARAKAFAKHD
jgi:hypothetical protein